VVVVGAGPAGLLAACAAAERGAQVLVFERQAEPGIKLAATGGGRCNFTNTLPPDDFIRRFGEQGRFAAPALRALDSLRLRRRLNALGVASHAPDGWHVFPVCESARVVRDALLRACRERGVVLRCRTPVRSLLLAGGRAAGVRTAAGPEPASAVILAAGGAACPRLGGSGAGYDLARQVGHSITPLWPALAPLVVREPWPGTLTGVSLPRARVQLPGDRGWAGAAPGGLVFTHRGLSGPAALDVAGRVAEALAQRGAVALRLDLDPDRTEDAWRLFWQRVRSEHGARRVSAALAERVPDSVARALMATARVPAAAAAAELSRGLIDALSATIKQAALTATGTEGFGKAMATRGGVARDEVEPRTLESRRTPGLYLAGEILDVVGPCGGFNLHWALASGHLAGTLRGGA